MLINKEVLYKSGLDAPALIKEFEELKINKYTRIIADCSRPEMIKSLRDKGYNVQPSEKFAGSVVSGLNDVRKYTFGIVAGSKDIFKEIQNYQKKQTADGKWLEEPAPNQVDHLMDAIRYGEQATHSPLWTVSRRQTR